MKGLSENTWRVLKNEKGKETDKEYNELYWVSLSQTSRGKMRKRMYRYLVTRKRIWQPPLIEDETEKQREKRRYEVMATNLTGEADTIILWHYKRGGSIENVNKRIKHDLAGNRMLPCKEFGANAAWWRLNCLAHNILRAMQYFIFPDKLKNSHLKKLRLYLFNIAGRVIRTGRQIILRIHKSHPGLEIYKIARDRIACFAFS